MLLLFCSYCFHCFFLFSLLLLSFYIVIFVIIVIIITAVLGNNNSNYIENEKKNKANYFYNISLISLQKHPVKEKNQSEKRKKKGEIPQFHLPSTTYLLSSWLSLPYVPSLTSSLISKLIFLYIHWFNVTFTKHLPYSLLTSSRSHPSFPSPYFTSLLLHFPSASTYSPSCKQII